MYECKSCYTCIYCYRETSGYEVWCPVTGKIIDNGFGEGCSDSCERYIPERSLYTSANNAYDEEPLLF